MGFFRLLAILVALVAGFQPAFANRIADADLSSRVAALGTGGFDQAEKAIAALSATGDGNTCVEYQHVRLGGAAINISISLETSRELPWQGLLGYQIAWLSS